MDALQALAWTLGGVTALAGAVRGVPVVWNAISRTVHAVDAIVDLTSADGWPNGSTNLKDSHLALYSKMESMQEDIADIRRLLTGSDG